MSEPVTIARITDTPKEAVLDTPTLEEFVRYAVADGADISDDPDGVMGWFGGQLTGELLTLTFTKDGQTFADRGEYAPDADRADSAATFLSLDAVVSLLVESFPRVGNLDRDICEKYVLDYVERMG